MERTKVFRGLRIAWTAAFGILCVLLICLWVRSYWWQDNLQYFSGTSNVHISANRGRLLTLHFDRAPIALAETWSYYWREARIDMDAEVPGGFVVIRNPQMQLVEFPLLFAVLFFVGLIVAPWLPHRFSLRTLLIATTLIAILLGLVVWAMD